MSSLLKKKQKRRIGQFISVVLTGREDEENSLKSLLILENEIKNVAVNNHDA